MTDSRLDIPGPRSGTSEAPPALEVVARDVNDGVAVVEVRGDLDSMTASGFEGWVRERLPGWRDVVLDLDEVGFLASAGVAVLIRLRQEATRRGMRVHLAGRRNRAVSHPLRVLGLEAVLDLQPDARAVVAGLAPAR